MIHRQLGFSWNILCSLRLLIVCALLSLPVMAIAADDTTTPAETTEAAQATQDKADQKLNQALDQAKEKVKSFKDNPADFLNQDSLGPILGSIDAMRETLGKRAIDLWAKPLGEFIGVLLAIWLLFQAGWLIFGDNTRKIFNMVLWRLVLTIMVIIILNSPTLFWQFHQVITHTGADIARLYMQASSAALKDKGLDTDCQSTSINRKLLEKTDAPPVSKDTQALACQAVALQKVLGVGVAIGMKTMQAHETTSLTEKLFGNKGMDWLWQYIAGLALVLAWLPPLIRLPATFIDVLLKWTAITILSPIMISAFLFPLTRAIAVNGIKLLLQAAFTLIFVAVIAAMAASILTELANVSGTDIATLTSKSLEGGIFDPLFWNMFAFAFITGGMLKQAPALAETVVETGSGMRIPSMASQAIGNILGAAGSNLSSIPGTLLNGGMDAQRSENQALRKKLWST